MPSSRTIDAVATDFRLARALVRFAGLCGRRDNAGGLRRLETVARGRAATQLSGRAVDQISQSTPQVGAPSLRLEHACAFLPAVVGECSCTFVRRSTITAPVSKCHESSSCSALLLLTHDVLMAASVTKHLTSGSRSAALVMLDSLTVGALASASSLGGGRGGGLGGGRRRGGALLVQVSGGAAKPDYAALALVSALTDG